MSIFSCVNGASCTQSVSWLLKLFLIQNIFVKTKLKTKGITRPLTPVLQFHPKRQTQGPKKRFMMDKQVPEKPGGTEPLPLSRASLRETVTFSCYAVHQIPKMEASGAGKVTKLFSEAAALREPGSPQDLKLSSVPHLNSYTVPSPLPLCPCKPFHLLWIWILVTESPLSPQFLPRSLGSKGSVCCVSCRHPCEHLHAKSQQTPEPALLFLQRLCSAQLMVLVGLVGARGGIHLTPPALQSHPPWLLHRLPWTSGRWSQQSSEWNSFHIWEKHNMLEPSGLYLLALHWL